MNYDELLYVAEQYRIYSIISKSQDFKTIELHMRFIPNSANLRLRSTDDFLWFINYLKRNV